MTSLRNFERSDAPALRAASYPEKSVTEVENLINEWSAQQFNGKYSEKLAVLQDGLLVGAMFLYQHTSEVISIGPEIFPAYRKRGIGKEALSKACDFARSKGYKIVLQQIRIDNVASIALHTSLGFETNGLTYISRKGARLHFI